MSKIRAEELSQAINFMGLISDQIQTHHSRIKVFSSPTSLILQIISTAGIMQYRVPLPGEEFEAIYPVDRLRALLKLTGPEDLVTLKKHELVFGKSKYSIPPYNLRYPSKPMEIIDVILKKAQVPFRKETINNPAHLSQLLGFAGKVKGYYGVGLFPSGNAIASDARSLAIVEPEAGKTKEPTLFPPEMIKVFALSKKESMDIEFYSDHRGIYFMYFQPLENLHCWFPVRESIVLQDTTVDERKRVFDHPYTLSLDYDGLVSSIKRLLVFADKALDFELVLEIHANKVLLSHKGVKSGGEEELTIIGKIEDALVGTHRKLPGALLKKALGALSEGEGSLCLSLHDKDHQIHAMKIYRQEALKRFVVLGFRR